MNPASSPCGKVFILGVFLRFPSSGSREGPPPPGRPLFFFYPAPAFSFFPFFRCHPSWILVGQPLIFNPHKWIGGLLWGPYARGPPSLAARPAPFGPRERDRHRYPFAPFGSRARPPPVWRGGDRPRLRCISVFGSLNIISSFSFFVPPIAITAPVSVGAFFLVFPSVGHPLSPPAQFPPCGPPADGTRGGGPSRSHRATIGVCYGLLLPLPPSGPFGFQRERTFPDPEAFGSVF